MFQRLFESIKAFGVIYTISAYYRHSKSIILRWIGYKYTLRKIYKFSMLLDLEDKGISSELNVKGSREEQLLEVLEEIINPGDHIIDLGANIGYYSLILKSLIGPSGKVYALEPSPENYKLLNKNIQLNNANNVIETFQMAGGSESGIGTFHLSERSNQNTLIKDNYRFNSSQLHLKDSIEVQVIDLSSFIKKKPPIDLIRMDIEGYEVSVIKGLKTAIETKEFQGKIVFETHWPKYDDLRNNMREQIRMLFKNGYKPSIITSNKESPSKLTERDYVPKKVLRTGPNREQGIYYDIDPSDAEYFICDVGGVRDVVLEK